MTSPDVVSPDDAARAIATITTAFADDAVTRWFLPDPHQYLEYWPPFIEAMGGAAFAEGTAASVDGFAGVALWLGPGIASDEEAMGELAAEAVPTHDQAEKFAFLEQMGEFHPTEPHWYLPLIGVDPLRRGNGYGSALLSHAVARCDRDKLPAYLEATSSRNKALYARHGFEAIGEIQSGSSPPLWPMLRRPS